MHIGQNVFEVKFGVEALRTLRASIIQMVYWLSEGQGLHGYVVFVDFSLSVERFHDEWRRLTAVLRPELLERLTICLVRDNLLGSIPTDLAPDVRQELFEVIEAERGKADIPYTDYSFIIPKLLIYHWLISGTPLTLDALARTAGCSFLTATRALSSLGSLVERTSARQVALRWFPEDEWSRLVAVSDRARSTVRFAAPAGEARGVAAHVQRLEKIAPSGVAIGGGLGAAHLFARLDLVGAPRLDLSLHCPGKRMNLGFVKLLDPALKQVDDPLQPAILAVHAVRHADPLFEPRAGGLFWADPVECALDLSTAKLAPQAAQFLDHLQSTRPKP